jgi:hypothetical protein
MMAYDYSLDPQFSVTFNPCTRAPQSWSDEVDNTAQAIANSTNKPLYVLMSGGIDSEMVARAFLDNGIKFKALTLKHKAGTNSHDTDWADIFCKNHNIQQEILELDTDKFDTIIKNYIAQGYRSTNIYHYMQLYILEYVESIGGFAVGGAGEQIYYTIDNVINLKINPSYTLGRHWCQRNNTWHQLWFSLDNPEIFASYMQIDIVRVMLQDPTYFVNDHPSSTEKIIILHKKWPKMWRRNKFSGFEKLQKIYRDPTEQKLKARFPDIQDLIIPIINIQQQLDIAK